jgi:hypothetical protein
MAHSIGVGMCAYKTASAIFDEPALIEAVTAAGVLHDVGYAYHLGRTGQHSIDGASYLAGTGVDDTIVCLVAFHTGADTEAEIRDLVDQLYQFSPLRDRRLHDVITYADLTTDAKGRPTTVEARFEDIRARHGAGSVTAQWLLEAKPFLERSISRVEALLEEAEHKSQFQLHLVSSR